MPTRIDEEQAVTVLRAAGAEPLQPHPGAGRPWPARCTGCGRPVRPRLTELRHGRAKACAFCAGRRVDPEEAAAVMRAAGLQPLEAYSRSAAPWRSRCTRCQHEVSPRYANVRSGQGGCGHCSGHIADAAAIEARMVELGWTLLEPYSGNQKPWRVTCSRCRRSTTKRWNDVQNGKPGCRYCAQRAVIASEAVESMRAAGLEPLTAYPGGHAPWPCRCTSCAQEVRPNLNTVRASGSGCQRCAWQRNGLALRQAPDVAAERMMAAGFTPLEPYPGSHASWACTHQQCGRLVRLTYHSVFDAGTGCADCAVSGFKPARPAVVYMLTHPQLNCHKIGVAGLHSTRLEQWTRRGWLIYRTRSFPVGANAYAVEQQVLRWLRRQLHLPPYLASGDGWTETVSADGVTLEQLWAAVTSAPADGS